VYTIREIVYDGNGTLRMAHVSGKYKPEELFRFWSGPIPEPEETEEGKGVGR
jgi:hypothetical protein